MMTLAEFVAAPVGERLDALRAGTYRPPIRHESVNGEPKPGTSIERTCRECGASFIGLAPGKTGERGLWDDCQWWCSIDCYAVKRPKQAANLVVNAAALSDSEPTVKENR